MLEQTTTRHNALIDPLLHVWGWEIPVYLFLGGLVAGMMILTGYYQLRKPARRISCVCARLPLIGLVLLTLGMLALFLDLEHKPYVWRLYTTFEPTSVMSWGAWILVLVYPVLLASVLVRPPELLAAFVPSLDRAEEWFERRPGLTHIVAAANVALGVALGIYTGILLSTLGARPLWSSSLLGPLFLFSGLSAAAALVHFVTGDPVERRQMEQADTAFLAVELALVVLFVIGLATSTQAHAQAAGLLTNTNRTKNRGEHLLLINTTSPIFDRVTIHLDPRYYPGGKFVITARNNSPEHPYIQSAFLNGKPLDKPWFYHRELVQGGTLELQLGKAPNLHWGSRPAEAPPSMSKPAEPR